jgi:hypothetical protein
MLRVTLKQFHRIIKIGLGDIFGPPLISQLYTKEHQYLLISLSHRSIIAEKCHELKIVTNVPENAAQL